MWSVRARPANGFNRGGIRWSHEETIVDSVPQCVIDEPLLEVKEIKQEVHTDAIKTTAKPKSKTK